MPVVLGVASAITSRRVATYGLVSTFAAIAIVLNAFRQRSNFYSAAVMLGGSNGCMMVLFNLGVFLTLCAGKIAQKIFFGPLRAVEVEHLHERLWYAITESLLAMTIFRDDFDSSFALLFGTMLFLKVFHWLAQDRVELMEQSPSVTRLFHIRMIAVLSLLFEFDLFFATFAIEVLLIDQNRKGIMIMFASEFFILTATLWATIAKYLINCQDMRSEEPWEAKSMYVFFVDLATDFLKLVTYLGCFGLILSYYGLPLNIIRDVYMTGRSFFGRLRDFIQYRAATRNMDTRFPDATTTDLSSTSDGTCIICREEMIARSASQETEETRQSQQAASSGLNETPKKLPCGHIFHFHCLRSWLERQQSCPTCRRTVFTAPEGVVPGQAQTPPAARADARPAAGTGEGRLNAAPQEAGGEHAGHTATEIAQTARDRMQSLVQQLQTDAQRRHARASGSRRTVEQRDPSVRSTLSQPGSSTPAASREPWEQSRRRLIASVFGASDGGDEADDDDASPATDSAKASQIGATRLNGDGSRHNSLLSHIPPVPSALHSSLRTRPVKRVGSAERDATPTRSRSKVHRESESQDSPLASDGKPSSDPVDAREAARIAALRRFEMEREKDSKTASNSRNVDKALQVASQARPSLQLATPPPRKSLPGDPQLIPLFNTDAIKGFESSIGARLPFPLAQRPPASNDAQTPLNNSVPSSHQPDLLAPISPLSLSSSELTQLAGQTRRSLESRLKLLHRVEGNVHNIVEELTRALSALPTSDIIEESEEHDGNVESVHDDTSFMGKGKGKEKEPVESIAVSEEVAKIGETAQLDNES